MCDVPAMATNGNGGFSCHRPACKLFHNSSSAAGICAKQGFSFSETLKVPENDGRATTWKRQFKYADREEAETQYSGNADNDIDDSNQSDIQDTFYSDDSSGSSEEDSSEEDSSSKEDSTTSGDEDDRERHIYNILCAGGVGPFISEEDRVKGIFASRGWKSQINFEIFAFATLSGIPRKKLSHLLHILKYYCVTIIYIYIYIYIYVYIYIYIYIG